MGAWKGWRVSPPTLGNLEQEHEQGAHVAHVELMHLLPSPALCCSSCSQPLARESGHTAGSTGFSLLKRERCHQLN